MPRNFFVSLICTFLLGSFIGFSQSQLNERNVTKQLKCLCGCGFPDLASCSCEEWAQPAKAEIRARIARGEDLETILKYFVGRHGEIVRTTPVAEGFNHAVWIIPALAIFVAALGLGFLIRLWKHRKDDHRDNKNSPTTEILPEDQKYIAELDRELYGP